MRSFLAAEFMNGLDWFRRVYIRPALFVALVVLISATSAVHVAQWILQDALAGVGEVRNIGLAAYWGLFIALLVVLIQKFREFSYDKPPAPVWIGWLIGVLRRVQVGFWPIAASWIEIFTVLGIAYFAFRGVADQKSSVADALWSLSPVAVVVWAAVWNFRTTPWRRPADDVFTILAHYRPAKY